MRTPRGRSATSNLGSVARTRSISRLRWSRAMPRAAPLSKTQAQMKSELSSRSRMRWSGASSVTCMSVDQAPRAFKPSRLARKRSPKYEATSSARQLESGRTQAS